MRRMTLVALALFALLILALTGWWMLNAAKETGTDVLQVAQLQIQVEKEIFNLVNKQREKIGLEPYEYSDEAAAVARAKTEEMCVEGYFDHESPVSGSLAKQFEKFGDIVLGKDASSIGENIANAQGYDAKELTGVFWVEKWMESPSHKANILSNQFDHIGIGIYIRDSKAYAAQEFYTDK